MTAALIFILAALVVLVLADLFVAWARLRRKKRAAQRRGRTHA